MSDTALVDVGCFLLWRVDGAEEDNVFVVDKRGTVKFVKALRVFKAASRYVRVDRFIKSNTPEEAVIGSSDLGGSLRLLSPAK